MTDKSAPWEKERLTALLEAAKLAISRSRYVFAAINIATLIMLSAEFNGTIPWVRNALVRAKELKLPDEVKVLTDIQRKELGIFSVPILGLKFSIYDINVLGAISLTLLAI